MAKPVVARPKVAAKKEEVSAAKTILEQLLEGLKTEPQSEAESAHDFYRRLCSATSEAPDADYESLSDEAKAWATNAIQAINDGGEIEPLEGVVDNAPAAEPAAAPDKPSRPTVKAGGAKPGRPSSAAKKAEQPAAEKAPKPTRQAPAPRGPGGSALFRDIVTDEWPIEYAEAVEKAKEAGIEIAESQMKRMYQSAAPVLSRLENKGLLKAAKAA
jgi:hypothetical protein